MNLKKLIYIICFSSMTLVNVGCSDFLGSEYDSVQPAEEYWTTKEEAKAVVMSTYVAMRDDLQRIVQWGELRGDMLVLGPASITNEEMLAFKKLSIYDDNTICKWVDAYQIIARCNSVIENVESVLEVDDTFDVDLCNAYLAEAVWMRALTYFRLVRTFKDVPYITWSYVSDDQDFTCAKSSGSYILDALLTDLEEHCQYIPEDYTTTWESKGRATKGAYFALMADICLWQERYSESLQWCDSLDALKQYTLLNGSSWFNLFYPGNSNESIFELQWSDDENQKNNLFTWFHNEDDDQTYAISTVGMSAFTQYSAVTDLRGLGATYYSDYRVWKYGGMGYDTSGANFRDDDYYDNNWIVYRYADIVLIRAEALIMLGDYVNAYTNILEVRTRAGYKTSNSTQPTTESAALTLLMNERRLEFAFESKRWYDLVRWATIKEGIYQEELINVLLEDMSASERLLYESKLQDPNGYYLPIYEDDIIASDGKLVQNTYYL